MTIHLTPNDMRSTRSPEYAERVGADPEIWVLSWLPDRKLSREQAFAGMQLDELLSDVNATHDRMAHAQINAYADTIGIVWEQAIIRLYKRMIERYDGDPAAFAPQTAPAGPRTAPSLFGHGNATRRVYFG
ncbi:hypothetical protein [Nocardia sp. AG03]|uniref:hypothetical protein n=1 Tax=Nocardia sp. AG03 TaxID=3025312 RepID=UPI0024185FCA|nr:hypothetical protein [Nocardia sp. AG03]